MMGIQEAFVNLAQEMEEDCAAATNLTTSNTTLMQQVTLYYNRLPTKEVDNKALHTEVQNVQGEIKISRRRFTPSRNLDTLVVMVSPTRTGEYYNQRGKYMEKHTTPTGGALHNFVAIGWEATSEINETQRSKATR